MTELKRCTCSAPAGAVHNKDCPLAIWTPPETLDANVQRMAWLLFLEWWKSSLTLAYERQLRGAEAHPPDTIKMVYNDCLAAAKIVRKLEQATQ